MMFLWLLAAILLTSTAKTRPPLSDLWLSHLSGPVLHRWLEFSELYQETLGDFKYGAKKLVMLEIGVQSGGSATNWVNWFGDIEDFVYVGLDINPLCKRLDESEIDSIHIEIGSQLDFPLLNELCNKYGPFDIIVDDGGHTAEMMAMTLLALFPCMTDNAFYFLEDTMTIASTDPTFSHYRNQTISDYLSGIFTSTHSFWPKEDPNPFQIPSFNGRVKNIQLMDSIVVIERAPMKKYTAVVRGQERIPFSTIAGMQYRLSNGQILNVNIEVAGHSSEIPHETIKEECRVICTEYPGLIKDGTSVEDCARIMKQNAILQVFESGDDYLYGDEPMQKHSVGV